jgi:hypothetical protein
MHTETRFSALFLPRTRPPRTLHRCTYIVSGLCFTFLCFENNREGEERKMKADLIPKTPSHENDAQLGAVQKKIIVTNLFFRWLGL